MYPKQLTLWFIGCAPHVFPIQNDKQETWWREALASVDKNMGENKSTILNFLPDMMLYFYPSHFVGWRIGKPQKSYQEEMLGVVKQACNPDQDEPWKRGEKDDWSGI